jgi:rfaE bifunctional protein kinase chain/domain
MQINKIVTLSELRNKILPENLKAGDSFVLCHGHYNLIHPGHMRFIEHAKSLGDKLVVAVYGDSYFSESEQKRMYPQFVRAQGVSALQLVDYALILDSLTLQEALGAIKPAVFVMGKEYEQELDGEMEETIRLAESSGTKVVYHSGEIHYASTELFHSSQQELERNRLNQFFQSCEKQQVNIADLSHHLRKFPNCRLLVVGDTIVDQYAACEPLGMSAEAPVVVVRELETQEYVGGAGIVAAHVRALGAECSYLSVVGQDQPADFVRNEMDKQQISAYLIEDSSRPTTFKIRYMVDNQKLFRVSRLQDHSPARKLETQLIERLEELVPQVDGVLVSDFVYGVMTSRLLERLVELAKKHSVKLFGDLQCSSQIGNILRFKGFDLICPTEREARIALGNNENSLEWVAQTLRTKTNSGNLLIKMGSDGFISYADENGNDFLRRQYFPALAANPLDVTGAGDSLLAAMSVSVCAGASLMEASAIGTCMASIAVQTVGNIPVSYEKLQALLRSIS